jgi:hypothetical protein
VLNLLVADSVLKRLRRWLTVAFRRGSESHPRLVLYRWHVEAGGSDPAAGCRGVVDRAVAPILRDLEVFRRAECVYAGKYWPNPTEVRLTLVADEDSAAELIEAIANRLGGEQVTQRVGPAPGDVLCRPDASWYRERLTEVNRIAIDLHGDPIHRGSLLTIWSPANNSELAAYLSRTSAVYRELCDTPERQTAFWRDFWRPGPEDLSYPGHWIENLVLTG